MITVVVKEPNIESQVIDIEDNLGVFKQILGGDLEFVSIHDLQIYKLDLLCNEHWRDLEMSPSLYHRDLNGDGLIGGPVILTSHDMEGDTVGLKDFQISIAKRWLVNHSI